MKEESKTSDWLKQINSDDSRKLAHGRKSSIRGFEKSSSRYSNQQQVDEQQEHSDSIEEPFPVSAPHMYFEPINQKKENELEGSFNKVTISTLQNPSDQESCNLKSSSSPSKNFETYFK